MKIKIFCITLSMILVACAPATNLPKVEIVAFTPSPTYSKPTPTPKDLILSPANASDISELGRLGKGIIKQILWAPDGKSIAVATSVGVYFYDASTYAEIRYIDTGWRVRSIDYTPDGKTLVTSDDYGQKTIKLWDVASGQLIKTLSQDQRSITCIALNGKETLLASGDDDYQIFLRDFQTGELVHKMTADMLRVESIACSPRGDLLATGSTYDSIQIWNAHDGKIVKTFEGTGEVGFSIRALAFSPDNHYLASGNIDQVKLWDIEQEKIVFSEGPGGTTSLSFSPNGNALASANHDGKVRIWDIPSGKISRIIDEHTHAATAVAYSPDGKILAFGSENGDIKFLDVNSGEIIKTLSGFSNFILDIALNPNGNILVSGGWQSIDVWDVEHLQHLKKQNVGVQWQESVVFSPMGEYFSSLGCSSLDSYGYCESGSAVVWDSQSLSAVQTIDLDENISDPLEVLFSPDGQRLVTLHQMLINSANNIKVWDVKTGQIIAVINENPYADRIIFNAAGDEIIAKSLSEIVEIDFLTGKQKHKFVLPPIHENDIPIYIGDIALSPDGKTLVVAKQMERTAGALFIQDMKTQATEQILSNEKAAMAAAQIRNVVFSPNGSLLAGASGSTIYLWDVQSWKNLVTLQHTDGIRKLIFSKDGKFLISCSMDGTIRIWGIQP